MRQLRLLIISIATICVFALAAFALVNRPPVTDPDDDIIIKGGSIELQCGKNHAKDCFGVPDLVTGKYKKYGNDNRKILRVRVKQQNSNTDFFNLPFNNTNQPAIIITYK